VQSKKSWPRPFPCAVWQVAELPEPQQPVPAQQFVAHAFGVAPGQAQLPPWQVLGEVQTFPQVPQLELSVATLLQLAPQHRSPATQAWPTQPPQWAASELVSKQPNASQLVRLPLLQAQLPAGQEVFPGSVQLAPQVPQFCGSKRLVQAGWEETALVHSTGSGSKQPQAPL
jgi:hypothetical protein